jgi:GTP-binding protein Era
MRPTHETSLNTDAQPGGHRAGFVAIGGRSNVGKSTLLNRLVGQKVAIVTPRPQTTRRRILGIRSDSDAQMILIDTPGLHESARPLNRRMVETARRSLAEGEVILAMVEARPRLDPADLAAIAELCALKRPTVVAINKIDLLARSKLIPLLEHCGRIAPVAEIVPVSAVSGENVEELVRVIKQMLPEGPPLMPADQYTDQSERTLAAEMVREQIFLAMREEVPFSTEVRVEDWSEERERSLIKISVVIVVERDAHKGMIIGAGGLMLKAIGTAARLEIEAILGAHVFLELLVKVERNWTRDPRKLAEMGL